VHGTVYMFDELVCWQVALYFFEVRKVDSSSRFKNVFLEKFHSLHVDVAAKKMKITYNANGRTRPLDQ
jgi:hypothetical protein